MKLNIKIAFLGAFSVLITAVALVILAVLQSSNYNSLSQKEVDKLIDADLDHITQGVYNLVKTEDEAVQYRVNNNLNVARHVLKNSGAISFSNELVSWNAINQFTNKSEKIQIPKMFVGNKWLGKNYNLQIITAVVDEIKHLTDESATIFQRMNENGDMIRVATTITTSDNERAISTYIPAINPNGSANPVINSILKGETYHGRAFVVNTWYLTAYEPIKDIKGKIVGMLYVGVKQKVVESRIRQAILQTKVGKSGYVYVLGGKNEDRGHYIISRNGERDGENIWEDKDINGEYVIQAIIKKAIELQQGELATIRYLWQNPGESTHRLKVVRLAYYAPWDWVIGTGVYEEELQTYREVLSGGRTKMINVMSVAGIIITLLIGLAGFVIAWTITGPLRQMTIAAGIITSGNMDQVINVDSHDEIGTLAQTFNFMVQKLKQTMEGLRKSEEFLDNIVENIPDMIFVKDAKELRFVRLNKAGEELLGYSSEELIGKNDYDFFLKEDADFFITMDRDALRSKKFLDIPEEKIQTNQKGERILHTKKIPIMDKNGIPQYLLGISEDITEIKKVEEKLKLLAHAIQSASEGISITDMNSNLLFVNEAFISLYGYEESELIGKNIGLVRPLKLPDEMLKNVELLTMSGRWTGELINKKKDGTEFPILLTTSSILNENGEPYALVGIIRDITERKRIEDTLRENQRILSTLMSNLPGMAYRCKNDSVWTMEFVSEGSLPLTGYMPEDLLQSKIISYGDLIHPDDRKLVWDAVQEGITKKQFYRMEYRLITAGGIEKWVWEQGQGIYSELGELLGLEGFISNITERKHAEELLFSKTILLETQMESSIDGILVVDDNAKVVMLNRRFCELWNIPNHIADSKDDREVFKIALSQVKHPKEFKNKVDSLYANPDEKSKDEIELIDGRIFDRYSSLMIDSEGKRHGRIWFFRDITKQKQNEEKIQKLSEVVEKSPIAVMITDTSGMIEYANPYFLDEFGYSSNEIIGKTPRILQSGNTSKHIYNEIWEKLNSGNIWKGIIQNKNKEGQPFWFNASFAPIKDPNGKVLSYAAIYLDITAQLNLLEELKIYKENLEEMVKVRTMELEQSREMFRALTENSKDVIIRFNDRFEHIYLNNAIKDFTHISAEEHIGKTHSELGYPADLIYSFTSVLKDVFHNKTSNHLMFEYDNKWIDCIAIPEFNTDGEVISVMTSSRDVTESKNLQLEIQKAFEKEKELNQLKSRFISMVSHEFRTPLTSILSSTDILEMGGEKLNFKDKAKHYNRIQKNIDYMIYMLDEILFMNKMESDRIEVNLNKTNLAKFCKEIFDEIKELYPGIKSKIKITLDRQLYNLEQVILRKILSNLISNAFKYNVENGHVDFTVISKNDELIFKIADTGIGIPLEEQASVFEPFTRMSNTQQIKGSGLGLSIVKKSVERLGGNVTFMSQKDKGTKFTVIIPVT